jgi:hypothetical protein
MAYNSLTLIPAYGRDYKSKRALLEDWEAGKDFLATGIKPGTSGYTSIRDVPAFKEDHITHLHFRYNKQTLVHVVKL